MNRARYRILEGGHPMGWLFLFHTSGGCSLWVASFGSNHSASPVKWYLRWTHILCSLSWGGLRTAWENRRTEPLPTAAAVGRQPAHFLRYLCSTSIARITDQSALTDGLRLAGSWQRFRPEEAKLPAQFQSQRTSRRHCFGTEVSPMVIPFFSLIVGRLWDETTTRHLLM